MMKRLLILTAVLAVGLWSYAQTGWIQTNSNLTAGQGIGQISVAMNNPDVFWAHAIDGDGAIIDGYTVSTDAGMTWTPGSFNAGNGLSMMFAIDANTCWAVFNTGADQGLYKTTDGGNTWIKKGGVYGSSSFANVIHFFDANNGFAQGDPVDGYYELYTTSDGGETWTRVPEANIPAPTAGEYGITGNYSAAGNDIWYGTNKGRIYHSSDKGLNWTVTTTAFGSTEVVQPEFIDANNGVAFRSYLNLGIEPIINVTTDGGDTWTEVSVSGDMYARSIEAVPNTTNTYVGSASADTDMGISYSLDGGYSWITITEGWPFQAMAWFDNETGYSGTWALADDRSTGGFYIYDGDPLTGGDPEIAVAPASLEMTLAPDEMDTDDLDITNTGAGELTYSIEVQYPTENTGKTPMNITRGYNPELTEGNANGNTSSNGTDVAWDLQFEYDVTTSSGLESQAGTETDGTYIYTTVWNTADILRFNMDGTFVESFTITGVTNLRDLAYDGTYFYGSDAGNYIWKMDFDAQTLIETISSPAAIRAIAYDDGNDAFWGNNWDADLLLIDRSGTSIDNIASPPSMYGCAYQPAATDGAPYLWLFTGTSNGPPPSGCKVEQVDLGTHALTGVEHQLIPEGDDGIAGGCFTHANIVPGTMTIGCLIQGISLRGYELPLDGPPPSGWLSCAPTSGSVAVGATAEIEVTFDATGLEEDVYTANIVITSNDPVTPTVTVPVTLTVEAGANLDPPNNLMAEVLNDVDVHLTWEAPGVTPEWIHWDSGSNDDGIGLTEGGTFHVAARFDEAFLEPYDGMILTKVKMFPRGYNTGYALKIWTGANASTLIVDEALSGLAIEEWNEITLPTPVTVDAGDELWVGYTCIDQAIDDFPAGTDAGPAVPGYGDMISMDGNSWDPLSGFGLDYNWNIQAYVDNARGESIALEPLVKAEINNNASSAPAEGNLRLLPNAKTNSSRAFLGYNVYRDEVMINAALVADLFYDDMGLAPGTYYYTVTAVYDEGESVPAGPVEAVIEEMVCDPPNNVVATNEPGSPDVMVTWEMPGEAPTWIHWDSGENDDGIGLTEGGTFIVAARFTPAELGDYDGMYLTKMSIFPRGYNTGYALKVFTGANAATLVLDQALSALAIEEWNEIELDTPVEIDGNDELWMGYECIDQAVGDYPAGTDAGPAVAGYGDMISMDGSSWDPLSGFGLDYNWNIQGYLEGMVDGVSQIVPLAKGSIENTSSSLSAGDLRTPEMSVIDHQSRGLLGYNVYRNEDLLTTSPIADLFYEDMGLENGSYTYCVTAVYDECESEAVCDDVDITVGIGEIEEALVNIYPNPANDFVNIEFASNVEYVELVNFVGQVVYSNDDMNNTQSLRISTSDFEAGVYFVQIKTSNNMITKKLTIQ